MLANHTKVFVADNILFNNDASQLIVKPNETNTYQLRSLKDGSKHEIRKNYFTPEEIVAIFKHHLPNFSADNYYADHYFWYVTYTVCKYSYFHRLNAVCKFDCNSGISGFSGQASRNAITRF